MNWQSLLAKLSLGKKKQVSTTSSAGISAFFKDGWLLSLVALIIYLTIALASYSPLDAAWSHSTNDPTIHNYAGLSGAWLSDMLLYLFGYSAWVIILSLVIIVTMGYQQTLRKQSTTPIEPSYYTQRAIGAFLCLIASCSIEDILGDTIGHALPLKAGGLLSHLLSSFLPAVTGSVGTVLLLMLAGLLGLSLLFHTSWLTILEKIGLATEQGAFFLWQYLPKKLKGSSQFQPPIHTEPVILGSPTTDLSLMPAAIKKKIRSRPAPPTSPGQGSLFTNMDGKDLPAIDLLEGVTSQSMSVSPQDIQITSHLIEEKLAHFGIEAKVIHAYPGPVITRYEIDPAMGVKGSQIVNLSKDLARALSLGSIRVVETIPGKTSMGLELPNPKRQVVRLSEIIGSSLYQDSDTPLTIAMGKDIAGVPVVANLNKMPHLLVAGTTGSGKSVALNAMILSLLFKATPSEVRMIMIDPKMLELSVYEGIAHLLSPVVTDMNEATNAFNWCVKEMDRRYRLMSQLGVRNLASFNQKILDAQAAGITLSDPLSPDSGSPELLKTMPFIVVIVDELADLMMVIGKKIEGLIARLAQKARAAGIHLILATQRPSVDVITGLIKANIPTRIAFQVSSKIDSRTILDQMGAESLLGQGDMLYLPPGTGYPQRLHGAFVADEEVYRVVAFLKTNAPANYVENILENPSVEDTDESMILPFASSENSEDSQLYDQAVAVVLKTRRASISSVQRHLRIGYNRAARLIEQMEKAGLVSPMESNGNRTILVDSHEG